MCAKAFIFEQNVHGGIFVIGKIQSLWIKICPARSTIEDLLFRAYFETGFCEKPLIIHSDYCLAGELHLAIQSLEIFSVGFLKFMGIFNITFLPNIASFMPKISVARARVVWTGMLLCGYSWRSPWL